jgi:hypothetical protein
LYVHLKYNEHTTLDIKVRSNKEVGDFSAASHWCKEADLMVAEGAEADRGGP